MEASYENFLDDLTHFRSLGASTEAIGRFEGLLNAFFYLFSESKELELALERRKAEINRLRAQLFGEGSGDIIDIDPEAPPEDDHTRNASEAQGEPSDNNKEEKEEDPLADNCDSSSTEQSADASQADNAATGPEDSSKGSGHGRYGTNAYSGAQEVYCRHEHLEPGDLCPECGAGKVYVYRKTNPKTKIVFTGVPPLKATKYVMEQLRCNLCQAYFDPELPINVSRKYQFSAIAMLAVLHCYMGMPYYRLARMQSMQGMPVAMSTQSELIAQLQTVIEVIFGRLLVLAANNPLIHQDDTTVKIVELIGENKIDKPDRKGMYTSVFVSKGENTVILVFSGRKHAGENFAEIIQHRDENEEKIVRMADALSCNRVYSEGVIDLNCNSHAFRRFELIEDQYPKQCGEILKRYGKIFKNLKYTKEQEMTIEEVFEYQTKHSLPIMNEIFYLVEKYTHECEPNSSLGSELKYMRNNQKRLTQTLLVPGAPFDNNEGERVIKIPIIYRKNSHIFKTTKSASHLSRLISVIATAEYGAIDPFDYIEQLQRFESFVLRNPDNWLPWTYQATLEQLGYATARQSSAMVA